MHIGSVNINGNIFLAPMAGVTDLPFRRICKKYGAALTYTEMVSALGLIYQQKKTHQIIDTSEEKVPIGVQLFGSEPESMAQAAQIAEEAGATLIDTAPVDCETTVAIISLLELVTVNSAPDTICPVAAFVLTICRYGNGVLVNLATVSLPETTVTVCGSASSIYSLGAWISVIIYTPSGNSGIRICPAALVVCLSPILSPFER